MRFERGRVMAQRLLQVIPDCCRGGGKREAGPLR